MNAEATEKTPLCELRYLLRNHLDICETAVILGEGRVTKEAALTLEDSANQIDEIGSALQLRRKPVWFTEKASRLYHDLLQVAWPYGSPWEECQLTPDYVPSAKDAIREVEELARLVGDDTVPDSRVQRSEHMTLTEMMERLDINRDIRTFKKWAKQFDLRADKENRQSFSIRLDLLPPIYRGHWDEYGSPSN